MKIIKLIVFITFLISGVQIQAKSPINESTLEGGSDESQLIWTDPKSGLTWMRCVVGEKYGYVTNGLPQCGREDFHTFTWYEAVLRTTKFEYAGQKDWRLPTFNEVKTIYECTFVKKRGGNQPPAEVVFLKGEWQCPEGTVGPYFRSELGFRSIWINSLAADYIAESSDKKKELLASRERMAIRGIIQNADIRSQVSAVYVRGGEKTDSWSATLDEAKRFEEAIKAENLAKQQSSEKERELAITEFKKREGKRVAAVNEASEKCKSDQKQLAKNVKQGDMVRQGLVIGFQGDLVVVQTYRTECHGNRKPDGSCNMFDIKKVAAGKELFRRTDLIASCRM